MRHVMPFVFVAILGSLLFLAPECPGRDCGLSEFYQDGLYLLRGTVVTPDDVISEGEVLFNASGILCAGAGCRSHPSYCNAQLIETDGLIFPGLVDAHNHMTYRFLQPWDAPQTYQNRCEWLGSPEYDDYIACHNYHQDDSYISSTGAQVPYNCIMAIYGEVAALMSGATSVQSQLSDFDWECAQGLARNVDSQDADEGWPGDNVDACTFPIRSCSGSSSSCSNHDSVVREIETGCLQAWAPHLAEGIDCTAFGEFQALKSCLDLLRPETAIIHATALEEPQFEEIAQVGAKIITSLRSNINLYGRTLDVPTVFSAYQSLGLSDMISISTDWCPSGSCNFFDEFSCIQDLNRNEWGNLFTDEDLVKMATKGGAHTLGIDERSDGICYQPVGQIADGFEADLLVISKDSNQDPYKTLLTATEDDVLLVFVGGIPLYGIRQLMQPIVANPSDCEDPSNFLGCSTRDLRLICLNTPNYQLSLQETVSALKKLKTDDPNNCKDPYPFWTCDEPETCQTTVAKPNLNCSGGGRPPEGCFRISEVMVNTANGSSNKAGQFIEVCNVCDTDQNINGVFFTDGDSSGLDFVKSTNPAACSENPNWVCNTTMIPAGGCGVILDPDYFAVGNTETYTFSCPNTVILGINSGSALGQGLSATDPITLYDNQGTTLDHLQDTYGTPSCTDNWEDCDDDGSDCIPLDPADGLSVHRGDLEAADQISNWNIASPTPGCLL